MKEWILFIPEGSCKCSSRMGSNCFYLCFIELVLMKGTWPFYFRGENQPFWNLQKMFYPPKGDANAAPVWGPIVFTYILSSWSWWRVLDTFVSGADIGLFEILKMFYRVDGWMGGWVGGWMGGWVCCDFFVPSISLIFKYDNKQYELIPKLCLKVALAF